MNLDTLDIDTLISAAVAHGTRFVVARRTRRAWTDADDAYLRKQAGVLTDQEIALVLHRTENAVKVRRVRLMLPARGSHPAYISASAAAVKLGLDEHKLTGWIDTGLIPGEIYLKQNASGRCASGLYIRRVRLVTLKRWLTRPHNWPRFQVEHIADPAIKSLVRRAQSLWPDEWWSTPQVAAYHGVSPRWVCTKIHRGELPALRVANFGGRNPDGQAWAYNFVKRSDAVQAVFLDGKGSAQARRAEKYIWTPRADAWLLRASAAGMRWTEIAARMQSRRGYTWDAGKVAYRHKALMARETA